MENLTSNTNNNNNKQTEKLFISLFLYISTVSVCVGQQLLLLNSAIWINIAMITWWPLEKKKNNIKYVQMDTDRLNSVHYIVFVWQEKCAVFFSFLFLRSPTTTAYFFSSLFIYQNYVKIFSVQYFYSIWRRISMEFYFCFVRVCHR